MTDKPIIEIPAEAPPTELVIDDITVGQGAEVTPGDLADVHYVGVAWSTGKEFDTSWGRGPLQFRPGTGQVIRGWDEGLIGMKVGGRRKLTIPAHLAYGDRGAGGVIGPGETLVFVCDLVAVI